MATGPRRCTKGKARRRPCGPPGRSEDRRAKVRAKRRLRRRRPCTCRGSRDEAHLLRSQAEVVGQIPQPERKLGFQREVRHVARDDHMVDAEPAHLARHGARRRRLMGRLAMQAQVGVAGDALVEQTVGHRASSARRCKSDRWAILTAASMAQSPAQGSAYGAPSRRGRTSRTHRNPIHGVRIGRRLAVAGGTSKPRTAIEVAAPAYHPLFAHVRTCGVAHPAPGILGRKPVGHPLFRIARKVVDAVGRAPVDKRAHRRQLQEPVTRVEVVEIERAVIADERVIHIAPWVAPPLDATRRALPLGLGGKPSARPGAVALRVVPRDEHDGQVRPIEPLGSLRERRQLAAARRRTPPVAGDRHLGPVNPVIVQEHLVGGLLGGEHLIPARITVRL